MLAFALPWEGKGLGSILTPQAPGLTLEDIVGSFLLGPHPRPFHNRGRSAGQRVRVTAHSTPTQTLSDAPSPPRELARPHLRLGAEERARLERPTESAL